MPQDDFLKHYGVLGMKWGVRKQDRQARYEARKEEKLRKKNEKEFKKKVKRYNTSSSAVSKSQTKRREKVDERYSENIKKMNKKSDELRRESRNQQNRRSSDNRQDRRPSDRRNSYNHDRKVRIVHDSYSKPYPRKDQDRYQKKYDGIAKTFALSVAKSFAGTLGSKLAEPTGEYLGKKLAAYIITKTTKAVTHKDAMINDLKHYGVKGMKWNVTKKKAEPEVTSTVLSTPISGLSKGEISSFNSASLKVNNIALKIAAQFSNSKPISAKRKRLLQYLK